MEETLTLNAIWKAHHCYRAALQIRQHPVRDLLVVLYEVPLRYPGVREEYFVASGDLHSLVADADSFSHGRSRNTSRGSLSRRRPTNRGCRSLSSEVHSVKPHWATNLGSTQCTPLRGTRSPSNGVSSRSIDESWSWSRRSVSVLKPVPTWPAYFSFPCWYLR